jgi:ATP adenylyltransferase
MVIPNRHLADFEGLTADEQMAISTQTQNAIRILKTVMKPDGINLGYNLGSAAGAGLKEHLHQHVVPRWNGDTNFMPVVGETHVIPQSLLSLYDQLKPYFDTEYSD